MMRAYNADPVYVLFGSASYSALSVLLAPMKQKYLTFESLHNIGTHAEHCSARTDDLKLFSYVDDFCKINPSFLYYQKIAA